MLSIKAGLYGAKCPYGQVGDILWVRQASGIHPYAHLPEHKKWLYKTDKMDSNYQVK